MVDDNVCLIRTKLCGVMMMHAWSEQVTAGPHVSFPSPLITDLLCSLPFDEFQSAISFSFIFYFLISHLSRDAKLSRVWLADAYNESQYNETYCYLHKSGGLI